MISQSELKRQLHYNPVTGIFTWLVSNRNGLKIGDVAGSYGGDGYVAIRIFGKRYLSHRLAFLYMEGKFPLNEVDHVNHVKDDNCWLNLRHATRSENQRNAPKQSNNTSGFKGVTFNKKCGKFVAQATFNGKPKYIGEYLTVTLASEAYQYFAKLNYGDFYCAERVL